MKYSIDPDTIFFINEKTKGDRKTLECKTCGNQFYTEENHRSYDGLTEDCPFCNGCFPQKRTELEKQM